MSALFAEPFGGMNVVVSRVLPAPPSDGERARRIVRHGYADVLAWLGEEVGPKPDDQIHAVYGLDGSRYTATTVCVSAELYERLRGAS